MCYTMSMIIQYEKLVSQVLTTLRVQKDVDLKKAKNSLESSFRYPFITIAREPGSGGKLIGEEVARRLKYTFYDHELIEEIAKSSNLRKSILSQIDEKGRSSLQDMMHALVDPDYISDVTYVTQLCKVIIALAYKGKVVILGRGANMITPFAQGLHVRTMAPYKVRLQRAMDYEGHSLERAKEILLQMNNDRKNFVKQYFDVDIEDPKYYDLTINTTFYRPHEAADVVMQAFKKKFPRA